MRSAEFSAALPPSRACSKREVPGIWKLIQIFEVPSGAETADFAENSVQYMLFNPNSIYGKYNSGADRSFPPDWCVQPDSQHNSALQQYLVQNTGIMLFLSDRIAIDTQACFIVVNPVGNFSAGQMLLMPPEGQIQGRLVKSMAKA